MQKYIATIFLVLTICVLAFAQVATTPNLQLQLPARGTQNFDVILNNNFSVIDTTFGVLLNAYQGAWNSGTTYSKGHQVTENNSLYVSLINGNTNNDPAASPLAWRQVFNGTGTVTSVSDPPLLYTVANRTTIPAFAITTQAQNAILAGPAAGGSGPWLFRAMVAADLPTLITASTTGNAATSTQFSSAPTTCAAGSYARGVDTFGNATGCTVTSAGGTFPQTKAVVTNQWLASYDATTGLFTSSQPAFSNISGTWTKAQALAATVFTDQANTYTAGVKQTFTSSTVTAGESFGGVAADPSTLVNGDRWYRTDISRPMVRAAGVTQQYAFVSDLPVIPAPGTAGNYQRSTGTAWASSAIQAADVPTLNQSTTGTATGNYMNWSSGPIAGNISSTTGVIITRTTLPAAIRIRSFTMFLGTATAGCTTLPIYQLVDNTTTTVISSITLVNGTAYYSNTGLNVTVPSGDDVVIKVGTGSTACTQQPSNAVFTAWYTM